MTYDRVTAESIAAPATAIAEACAPVLARGRELLQRVQVAGGIFTLHLRECSRALAELQQGGAAVKGEGKTGAVQQVLLRKVLAVDRGQAGTLARCQHQRDAGQRRRHRGAG